MKINKHLLSLLYLICTLLIPVLHTGGLLCPHHLYGTQSAVSFPDEASPGINKACNEHDDENCQICRFSYTLSQIQGKSQVFNIVFPLSAISDIKPQDFIITKYKIFSNPPTAPPAFSV
ncbi:MAG: hypothetical protein A2017_01580 [Lentisphaerae bacterium GWF2_44_16]|nr:MAG: hypothetical protein A2017_01580 [Lentisphaerae bacterium GWF2_44_16]